MILRRQYFTAPDVSPDHHWGGIVVDHPRRTLTSSLESLYEGDGVPPEIAPSPLWRGTITHPTYSPAPEPPPLTCTRRPRLTMALADRFTAWLERRLGLDLEVLP